MTQTSAGPGATVPSAGCAVPQTGPVTNLLQGLDVSGSARWYLLTTPAPDDAGPSAANPTGGPGPPPSGPRLPRASARAPLRPGRHLPVRGARPARRLRGGHPEWHREPVHWDTTDPAATNPDLAVRHRPVDQVEATQCIDTSRVYATGFSDGAYHGLPAGLHHVRPDRRHRRRISGLAMPDRCCNLTRPVPVIAFHGTADPILYFNGGTDSAVTDPTARLDRADRAATAATQPARSDGPGVPATVREWAVKEGCDPTADRHPTWAARSSSAATPVPPAPTSASTSISAGATTGPGSLARRPYGTRPRT